MVNFLTRKNFQGLQFSASHQDIADSDGNQEFGAIFGTQLGDFDWVTSFGYETRSELSMRDRDFTTQPYSVNPQGGFSSIGHPGVYFMPSEAGSTFGALPGLSANGTKDPNCEALGGVDNSLFCRFRYTDFDNLIEEEERYQLFSELNRGTGQRRWRPFGSTLCQSRCASVEDLTVLSPSGLVWRHSVHASRSPRFGCNGCPIRSV